MSSHDAERAYVQSMLDVADDRFDETIQAMQTDIDRLRDEWAAGYAEQRQAHESRMAAMRDETRAYLRSISTGEAPGPAPTPERPGAVDASVSQGHRLQDHNPDPREAELTDRRRAQEIAQMSLGEYAQRRAELGVRSPTGMFGDTR